MQIQNKSMLIFFIYEANRIDVLIDVIQITITKHTPLVKWSMVEIETI